MENRVYRENRQMVYKGAIIDIYKDTIVTPEGNHADWDFIGHKGAAAVLPVMEDNTVLLVKQWRNAIDRYTLEITAGGKETEGESAFCCASRELEEETGLKLNKLH